MKNGNKTTLYEPPEMEVIAFEIGDVITTSGYNDNDFVPDGNIDDNW